MSSSEIEKVKLGTFVMIRLKQKNAHNAK